MTRRKNEGVMDILELCPWWVSVIFSIVVMALIRFVIPLLGRDHPFLSPLAQTLANQYWWVGAVFLIPGVISYVHSRQRARLLDSCEGLASIRNLHWKQFEQIVGEAFRRQGFEVVETGGGGADGGIDLRISFQGKIYLVQCKHWRSFKVGVKDMREFLGVITDAKADGGYFLCSGSYSADATTFAAKNSIILYDGEGLWNLIKDIRRH